MILPTSEKWRNANRPVKAVFNLNPWLGLIYLMALFGAKFSAILSFSVATMLTLFFVIVEYKGFPAMMALRWLRSRLLKNKKRLYPRWIKQ